MKDFNATVTDIIGMMTVSSVEGRKEKMHCRKYYGLSLCREGQITYVCNGKSYVSDRNHAVLLPKNGSYSIIGDKKGVFPVINFEATGIESKDIAVFTLENTEMYLKEFEKIDSLLRSGKNRYKAISILYDIMHSLVSEGEKTEGVVLSAIKFIEENFGMTELNNSLLAKHCNISEVYFRKLFSSTYSITPRQYIINLRINKAKQFLTDSILAVGVISEKCGFSNSYHFCRLFKEKTGLTPTQYRHKFKTYTI